MIEIYNDVTTIEELVQRHEHIYLYGAGASCRLLLMAYWEKMLRGHIDGVIDANKTISGTDINIKTDYIKIIDLDKFSSSIQQKKDDIVLLLTPMFSGRIVDFLDTIEDLEGIKVYLWPMICNNQRPGEFRFKSTDTPMIPKRIHYFWIGDDPLPEEYKKNIEGWRQINPSYEIICWNENNYDFFSSPYMKEAYEIGGEYLMYATDYARMDVLYRYGGIYMDTDVEALRPFDELLYNRAFIGVEENAQVNSGSAMGAIAGHHMVKKIMDTFENRRIIDKGGIPLRIYNTFYETKCLIENGYKLVNNYQIINDMVCFPREVFMPISLAGMEDSFTDHTICAHKINPEQRLANKTSYEKWKSRIIKDGK